MKKNKTDVATLSNKEWKMFGFLVGLGLFYYVLIRWVILEKFCSEETIEIITKYRYAPRGSILGSLIAFCTLVTFFSVLLLKDYWKIKRENKK